MTRTHSFLLTNHITSTLGVSYYDVGYNAVSLYIFSITCNLMPHPYHGTHLLIDEYRYEKCKM